MTCFKLLIGLCQDIKALIHRFIWEQSIDSQKIHWIKWQEMRKPKTQGGMGFKDLSMFSNEPLAKQMWHLLHDTNLLLYKVFKEKYFPTCSVMEAKNPSSASYTWKSIIKGREVIQRGGVSRVGDCHSIWNWHDNWFLVKQKPKIISPNLHIDPDAIVSTFIDQENQS